MPLSLLLSFLLLLKAVPGLASIDEGLACADALKQVEVQLARSFGQARASVLIQHEDRVLVQKSFGSGIDARTPFLLGSVSKPLTAAATVRLLSREKLDLEMAVVPELPPIYQQGLPPGWSQIRLRNLMHHTSGIADYLNRPTPQEGAEIEKYLKVEREYAQILGTVPKKLDFEPGKVLTYSNTNYLIVAQVIAKYGMRSYSDLMKEEVFGPLRMDDSGQLLQLDPQIQGGSGIHPANMQGVGSAYSTPGDLMKFLRALDRDEYISKEWVKKMFTADTQCAGAERCARYGLGFSLRDKDLEGRTWVLHQGHLRTVSSIIAKIPELQLNLAWVTDLNGFESEVLAKSILTQLLQAGCARSGAALSNSSTADTEPLRVP